MAKYVLDFAPAGMLSGTPVFTVFRDFVTGVDHLNDAPTLSGLTNGYVDFTWSSGVKIHFRAELSGAYITGQIDPYNADSPIGEGSTRVDHDYGSTDALRILDEDTLVPIDNAFLYVYLTEDYDAGRTNKAKFLKAWTTTNTDGRWTSPLYLDPGANRPKWS